MSFHFFLKKKNFTLYFQINKVARENNINIIFAVPVHRNLTYQLLTNSISASSIGLLENDSKNIVALISQEYEVTIKPIG